MRTQTTHSRRLLNRLDSLVTRLYGWRHSPLHQPGTLAALMLVVMLVTGLYLVFGYRVGDPSGSVARLAADPWLGGPIRSIHRYASDLFVIAALFHGFRMFAQRRTWGPRSLAWVSGLVLVGIGLICAWTGFVMAWDVFGARLAIEGARWLDVLPIFSEPLSRIFSGDGPVPSAFFFVNLFLHIALPLAMGIGLWLHVSRVARPTLLPPRLMSWTIIGILAVLAVVLPARLGAPADPFALPGDTPLNLVTAWWLPITERLGAGVVWLLGLVGAALLIAVPRFTRPRPEALAPSVVDPRLCTGCNQCPQDCPWEAITMVERDDDRPTLVARVDPTRCVSCGICAGSCAPMGVGPPGRTGRDQVGDVRELLRASGVRGIVALCCDQAQAAHRAALTQRGVTVRAIPCVGNLHSSVVELLIRGGAAGVIVYGCPPRDCVGREGPKWLVERLFHDREAELQPRVDRRRVQVATMAAGDLAGTLAAHEQFAKAVEAIAPTVPEPDPLLEQECAVALTGEES
ncbi:MAG: hydrogenase iron-sulfur subunit [Gemmatimonadetes bacterium]|nr:hydrogenase iron-sulfur subunit [Gemmatimonadota bacterium]MCA9763815.1 hydrogenase iron-sulfur subunit [Gemmatimonadota bacterium]MCA9769478.1 hydrogenase iron-sulfur subunit [Gemmatimonadota bacterium]MCB9517995.1 hydrogenase iron-sulfur subunit [Gemmatimonadales bacterium]HPE12610.1 hydrogenase iron-sulfur subunit [Actinomycetota bacterium]